MFSERQTASTEAHTPPEHPAREPGSELRAVPVAGDRRDGHQYAEQEQHERVRVREQALQAAAAPGRWSDLPGGVAAAAGVDWSAVDHVTLRSRSVAVGNPATAV
jgi:hypothetical protein